MAVQLTLLPLLGLILPLLFALAWVQEAMEERAAAAPPVLLPPRRSSR